MSDRRAGWAPIACATILAAVACAAPVPASRSASARPPSQPPVAAGQAPAATDAALQAIVDAARQEGQLTLTWGEGTVGGSEAAERLADGLNRRYGLSLAVQFTPGPPMSNMATKLIEEAQANRRASTDVFVGYANTTAELTHAGALLPVDWSSWAPHVRNPDFLAPNGVAATFQTSYTGITYNTQRVTGDAIPRSMQDLLKPQYRGRIASTPYGAIFDYLATDEVWGEPRTIDYVTRLADQLAGLIRCNETARVASGEFELFALTCSQSNALEPRSKGAPIDILIPSDAAFLQPLYMSVPRNAAHPNAAKLWIDYMFSREVQELLWSSDFQDSHLIEGSNTAKQIDQLKAAGVQFAVADVDFVLRQDESEFGRRRARIQQILSRQ